MTGRGQGPRNHPGNVYLRQIAQQRVQQYAATSKQSDKEEIAKSVIDSIKSREPPGRFLKKTVDEPNGRTVWRIMSERQAIEKVKQAMRNMISKEASCISNQPAYVELPE